MSYCLEEVFEMACQIERNGIEFYQLAAEQVTFPEAQELFRHLAKWEVRHIRKFEQLLAEIPEEERTEYFDPDSVAATYIDSMMTGKIFDPEKLDAPLPSSLEGIFLAAIEKEKSAILFYQELKETVPQGKEQVDSIIEEEQRHVEILSKLLTDLKKHPENEDAAG